MAQYGPVSSSTAQYAPVRPSMVQDGSVCPSMAQYPPVCSCTAQYAPVCSSQYVPLWPSRSEELLFGVIGEVSGANVQSLHDCCLPCLYLRPRSVPRSRALHEVLCPRPSRAGCRGVGRASDRWMARSPSPHYGGYTTHAVVNGSPRAE